ncbi:HD domain-containing protein [Rahnella sp. BIGb0236]|uniref:HD domain-containing phosphohydrolase n=1 Tax=Rahnella sp. BIGb0236 TaxID=2485117 RepID=UPI00105B49D4|nr:HD domain-containing phosphohydrolase [Rahnella sp. BIGb0236]TDS97699.1 HD domain-containing protein [Rahnella sp. BIGb0236]
MSGYLSGLTRRYPLHLQIATLFTLLIVVIGSVIALFSHSQLTRLTQISAARQYQQTGDAVAAELHNVTRTMMMSVNILTGMPVTGAENLSQRMAQVGKFIEILRQNDYASSVYIGYAGGDFFMLRRITAASRAFFQIPANAKWLVQSNQWLAGKPEKRFIYLDDNQHIIGERVVDNELFDPRSRDWFIQASHSHGLVTSPNYLFKGTGETGFTYSRLADNQQAVIGLDVSLALLSQFLKQQDLPAGSQAEIVNFANESVASQPLRKGDRSPELQALLASRGTPGHGDSRVFRVQDEDWFGSVISLSNNGNRYQLLIATPSATLTAGANAVRNRATLVAFVLLLLSLPVVWFFSLRISRPLLHLQRDAESISSLIFDEGESRPSAIAEVDDLRLAMAKMRRRLKQFISMGSILSAKDNFPRQMQGLLDETTDIADMDGGIIFLADKHGETFTPVAVNRGNAPPEIADVASVRFDHHDLPAFWKVREGTPVAGVFRHTGEIPAPLRDLLSPYLPLHYFAVPMQTHDNHLLGFLLVFSVKSLSEPRQKARIQLVDALVGSLSVAIETQYLLQEQKNLLNAFIELIAGAIDAKSPYTGGHCQRVPEITKMLAQAAVDSQEGPFSAFTLTDHEWEELHTACWLHDCGKITTPEFVVDKATKLELIYDRIHEIRMRFEVLKREKEIDWLRCHATGTPTDTDKQSLAAALAQLDDDFAFIARCNIGTEFLSDAALLRIQHIAGYQWTRTLDDTAGVSAGELARKGRRPAQSLPVQEPLLADKEEHIIYRDSKNHLPESYQFRLREPVYLYNYGEIYNLSVRRGTLNDEERYKINEHIMQTIIMLKKLPFPRTMANVPVIAGGHHERMDGKGYPYQLSDQQMSIPVKMMAVADVFEALTAADRPYKPGKRLSEALNIMTSMVNEQHLNRDVFVLFLQSGIWRDYASRYLLAENVDEVDVAALLQKLVPQQMAS